MTEPRIPPPWGDKPWKPEDQPKEVGRLPSGQFPSGVSGNPAGPPKGTRQTRTLLAEQLKENGSALLQVAMDKAMKGDASMLHLCLSRLVPVMKPKGEKVRFTLNTKAPLAEQTAQVAQAVADGELTPDDGLLLMQIVTAHMKVVEATEEEARLRALEAKNSRAGASTYGAGVVIMQEIHK